MQKQLEEIPPLSHQERKKRKRERLLIVILSLLFIIFTAAEFRLSKLSSTLPFVNSIFFFGLLNINIIILTGLVWLVIRNIGKLFIERRRKVLGSRLKTKLVIAFLAFSVIPTLVLFLISALYINSSFDKWFSLKIQNTLQASLEITRTFYRNTDLSAMHFAEHISEEITRKTNQNNFRFKKNNWILSFLSYQRNLLSLDALEFYPSPFEDRMLSQKKAVVDSLQRYYPKISLDLLDQAFNGQSVSMIQHVGSGDLIRCLVPVFTKTGKGSPVLGVLVVSSYIPVSLRNKVDEIASVFDDYKDINPLKYPMKKTYFVILITITLVILFVAIWIGLYMARELTVPVERLVLGAQEVGAGNLDVVISASGHDEISVLVESFNKMTHDLKENRGRLLEAGSDLERRRLQLEAVLAHIGTGVIAMDYQGIITTFNEAVARLLDIPSSIALNKNYSEILIGEASPLLEVIEKAFQVSYSSQSMRLGDSVLSESGQWNFRSKDSVKTLAAVATPLRQGNTNWGVVVVIDDMTYLIKGQREMAWREVARRIAHEIKNPLTPIKLSAQRLQRRLGDQKFWTNQEGPNHGKEASLLRECTDTIIKHTDELKEMVNEFSNFARFPEVSPAPHNLNQAISEVVSLYQQAHPEIKIEANYDTHLPIFEFDRDQMKRAIINLFDNAIAALSENLEDKSIIENRSIHLDCKYHEGLQLAVIEIQDNGPGMTEEVKARLFEPYFSTKKEGTGLGLSIVKRIINDHNGFIRVRSSLNEGTQFLIEIPTVLRHALDQRNTFRDHPSSSG